MFRWLRLRKLAPLLESPEPSVRKHAVAGLVELGGSDAAVLLARAALADKDKGCRTGALEGLRKSREAAGLEYVCRRLKEGDTVSIRCDAARLLEDLGDVRAAACLIEALQDAGDTARQTAAARALARLGSRKAVEPLIRVLSQDFWAESRSRRAKGRAGFGISQAGAQASLRRDENRVRAAAADALGALGDPSAKEALGAALKDEDGFVRTAARLALEALGGS